MISKEIIREFLINLNEFKLAGLDEINPSAPKELAEEILEPLTIMLAVSPKAGEVPEN